MLFETAHQGELFCVLFLAGFLCFGFAVFLNCLKAKQKILIFLKDFFVALVFCLTFFACNNFFGFGELRFFCVFGFLLGCFCFWGLQKLFKKIKQSKKLKNKKES